MLASTLKPTWRVQLLSRSPENLHRTVKNSLSTEVAERLEPPRSVDITIPGSLHTAFEDADVVVSAVGIMYGTPVDFERVQWKGAENIARGAHAVRAKLIHISAIGADASSSIPYARTKGLGEKAVFDVCPDATVIRPSIIFGPEDGFFGVRITAIFLYAVLMALHSGLLPSQNIFLLCLCSGAELAVSSQSTSRISLELLKPSQTGSPQFLNMSTVKSLKRADLMVSQCLLECSAILNTCLHSFDIQANN
jgi:uncharacterized protein YbjT (DUF2867 family)